MSIEDKEAQLLAHLNKEQTIAAKTLDGVSRVIAGPGTGKTASLTCRVANLQLHGADPKEILAITFTNKAAEQLQDRIIKLTGHAGHQVVCGTFHSLARRFVLNMNLSHPVLLDAGYTNGYLILDNDDSKSLATESIKKLPDFIKMALDALELKEKHLLAKISYMKAFGTDHLDYARELKNDIEATDQWSAFKLDFDNTIEYSTDHDIEEHIASIKRFVQQNAKVERHLVNLFWRNYALACQSVTGLDFDDLLVYASKMLSDSTVAKRVATQFKFILVDEFQDTNPVQFQMVTAIVNAQAEPNLMTIGDPRQSIYAFRCAEVGILLSLDEIYKSCITIEMFRNYRSTTNILHSANRHAITMPGQITDGQLQSGIESNLLGPRPTHALFKNDDDEARWVVNAIETLVRKPNISHGDIAMLYRTKTVRQKIQKKLDELDIPYQIIGDLSFYDRKESKVFVNLFRAIIRQRDVLALAKVVDASDISLTGTRLKKHAAEYDLPLEFITALGDKGTPSSIQFKEFSIEFKQLQDIENYLPKLNPFIMTLGKGQSFEEVIASIALDFDTDEELNSFIVDGYRKNIQESFAPYKTKLMAFSNKYLLPVLKKYVQAQKKGENIDEEMTGREQNIEIIINRLISLAADTGTFTDALDEMALMAETSKELRPEALKLMTIHGSKGLEFPIVFVLGCEEQTWIREESDDESICEEGRVYYVAKTRAEKMNIFTTCFNRYINGEPKNLAPLRFLECETNFNVVDKTGR